MNYNNIDDQLFKEMMLSGIHEIENNKDLLNALNVFPVPDGDTGTNMGATMLAAAVEINNLKTLTIPAIADAASLGSLMGARGNSGVILSQLLRGIAKGLKGKKTISTKDFAHALKEGVTTAYKAVMKPIEGTILTVARETADKAIEYSKHENDFENFFVNIYNTANISLDNTPNLLPALKQAGVVDAGGKGFALIILGMLNRLKLGYVTELLKKEFTNEVVMPEFSNIDTSDIKFGYCTEFFIKGDSSNCNPLKDTINLLGDSIVVVGMENIIKVHIHTNEPGTVLNEAMKIGELSKIKIDNMKEQHRSIIDEKNEVPQALSKTEEEKEYGIITVAVGDGISSIFKDLGIDMVIEGGQTMNPSTQDILKAIEAVNAKNIFILPNNGNIIMAAQQAGSVSDKNVIVIPTKSIPQGVTAAITFNADFGCLENEKEMKAAIENVQTGQITFAVRDTVFDDVEVKAGNKLALLNGKLVNSEEDLNSITKTLIDSMITDESEIVTLFYGNDLTETDVKVIEDYLNENYSDKDISILNGGQPIYYYIISVE